MTPDPRPEAESSAAAVFAVAVDAHVDGDLDAAVIGYREAGEAGSRDGWFRLGALLHDRDQHQEAVDAYGRAADLGASRRVSTSLTCSATS